MTILVTDSGFATDDWRDAILEPEAILAGAGGANLGVALSSSADPALLRGVLDTIDLIRVDFPSFSDGRGFTIARRLRLLGYQGRLRASGPLLADQYAMARRAGFDEVEIPDDMAARQTEDQWLARANWREHDYQSRLRA
ncbi:MAG: DUF934 domain-containing protein [Rhodobacteraceae bacterium]|jgi:uncharacterized protein (DUF934 family)|nr:DUF934 domain-containing protein [Paracoccaceae bacterium]